MDLRSVLEKKNTLWEWLGNPILLGWAEWLVVSRRRIHTGSHPVCTTCWNQHKTPRTFCSLIGRAQFVPKTRLSEWTGMFTQEHIGGVSLNWLKLVCIILHKFYVILHKWRCFFQIAVAVTATVVVIISTIMCIFVWFLPLCNLFLFYLAILKEESHWGSIDNVESLWFKLVLGYD